MGTPCLCSMYCTRLKNNVSFIFHQITNIGDYQLSIYRILAPILLIHVGTLDSYGYNTNWVFIQSGKLSCIGKTVGVLFEHTHIRCLAWLSASKLQFLWNWPGWFECKLPLNGTSFVHTITAEWMGKLIQFVVYPNKCHWYIFLNYYKICALIKIGR